jgi:hypothetical protein
MHSFILEFGRQHSIMVFFALPSLVPVGLASFCLGILKSCLIGIDLFG